MHRRLVRSGRMARLGGPQSWAYGLIISTAGASTALQIACLGFGVMTLITVGFVRTDLFSAWQKSLPPDAPNRFLINIQQDQIETIQSLVPKTANGKPVAVYPMVRGRLVAVNGKTVTAKTFPDERAKRLVDREFNLSASASLPPANKIIAGDYYGANDRGVMSIEEGIATTPQAGGSRDIRRRRRAGRSAHHQPAQGGLGQFPRQLFR